MQSSEVKDIAKVCKTLGNELVGQKYGLLDDMEIPPDDSMLGGRPNANVRQEILGWLLHDM